MKSHLPSKNHKPGLMKTYDACTRSVMFQFATNANTMVAAKAMLNFSRKARPLAFQSLKPVHAQAISIPSHDTKVTVVLSLFAKTTPKNREAKNGATIPNQSVFGSGRAAFAAGWTSGELMVGFFLFLFFFPITHPWTNPT